MEPADLVINLIVSSIGMGFFAYGKRRSEFYFLISGLILCVFPYFIDGVALRSVIGVLLIAAPFLARAFL